MLKHFVILIFLASVIASCKKDSNPTDSGIDNFIHPKVGSYITVESHQVDTATNQKIGIGDTVTLRVTQSQISYMGKTNVTEFTQDQDHDEKKYINYESNNDVSFYYPQLWVTFPTGSKTTTIIRNDTSYMVSGYIVEDSNSMTISYEGKDKITVKGEEINVIKLKQVDRHKYTNANPKNQIYIEDFNIEYIYYAPSIGYFVKSEKFTNPTLKLEQASMLIDYQIK